MRQLAAIGVIIAATFVLSAPAPARAQSVPKDARVSLERTSCFGECPIYSVSIDADGTVVYDGERFVRVEGRRTDRIPVSRVAALLETAGRIGFFDLKGKYSAMVTDLPTTFVTIRANGRSKRIEDYVGAPDGLHQLERDIDEAARTLRWVRIDAETVRHMAQQGWKASNDDGIEMLRNALEYDEVPPFERTSPA